MERKLRAKFARKSAAPAAVTSGPGWRLRNSPHHQDLETFAHHVWDCGFHGAPWLEGWRVRWADLAGGALGMCVFGPKLILVDEVKHWRREPAELLNTVAHEIVHALHGDNAGHGARFQATLDNLLACVTEPVAPPMAATARPHPTPVKGRLFGPRGWGAVVPGSEEWEFR